MHIERRQKNRSRCTPRNGKRKHRDNSPADAAVIARFCGYDAQFIALPERFRILAGVFTCPVAEPASNVLAHAGNNADAYAYNPGTYHRPPVVLDQAPSFFHIKAAHRSSIAVISSLKGLHDFRKTKQPDHNRDELNPTHEIHIAVTETRKGINHVKTHHGNNQAENSADPALQCVSVGGQLPADQNAENGNHKEFPRGKFQGKFRQHRGKAEHKNDGNQCAEHTGRCGKEDTQPAFPAFCNRVAVQCGSCRRRRPGDINENCALAAAGNCSYIHTDQGNQCRLRREIVRQSGEQCNCHRCAQARQHSHQQAGSCCQDDHDNIIWLKNSLKSLQNILHNRSSLFRQCGSKAVFEQQNNQGNNQNR